MLCFRDGREKYVGGATADALRKAVPDFPENNLCVSASLREEKTS